jgi:YHS domain-containing protein
MEALAYFILWAVIIVAVARLGYGAQMMRQGYDARPGEQETRIDQNLRWIAPKKDVDPVCGNTIKTAVAKPSVHDGNVYYFCSRDCREIFEAAPRAYVGIEHGTTQRILEHSHVGS